MGGKLELGRVIDATKTTARNENDIPDVVGEPHDPVGAPRDLVEVHARRVALDVGDSDGGAQQRRARHLHLGERTTGH